jgi:hypothetical protein
VIQVPGGSEDDVDKELNMDLDGNDDADGEDCDVDGEGEVDGEGGGEGGKRSRDDRNEEVYLSGDGSDPSTTTSGASDSSTDTE